MRLGMAAPEKYDHIDFKPPKSVAEAAEKGLEYRAKANPSDKGGLTPAEAGEQGIGSGVQRATNLKNRNEVSPDVIRQMCAFFARHEKNKAIKPENRDTPWKQKGYVAWLLWGGDPGKTWAEKVRDQMDRADEKADKTAMAHRVASRFLRAVKTELTPLDSIEDALDSIRLGPAGRAVFVKRLRGQTVWEVEPGGRQPLDDGDNAWDEDYRYPVLKAGQKWLNDEFGTGLFGINVSDEGHVDIYLTAAGKKKYGV